MPMLGVSQVRGLPCSLSICSMPVDSFAFDTILNKRRCGRGNYAGPWLNLLDWHVPGTSWSRPGGRGPLKVSGRSITGGLRFFMIDPL